MKITTKLKPVIRMVGFVAVVAIIAMAFIACENPECPMGHEDDPPVEMNWSNWMQIIAPSCETNGLEVRFCLSDSSRSEMRIVDARHNLSEIWTTTLAATCLETGIQRRTCQVINCGYFIQQDILQLGHNLSGTLTVHTAPACLVDGVGRRLCTRQNCVHFITESIPALGHNLSGTLTVHTAPACLVDGVGRRLCTRQSCVHFITESIPALGHQWINNWETTITPGFCVGGVCGTAGESKRICAFASCTESQTRIIPCGGSQALSFTSIEGGLETQQVPLVSTLAHVCIPDYHNNQPVLRIVGAMFHSNSNIQTVKIGHNVISIGSIAFASCINLTSITIPTSVNFIGNNAFAGCRGLTSITIPNSVTTIGASAFLGWTSNQTIHIPFATIAEADTVWGVSWRFDTNATFRNSAGEIIVPPGPPSIS